MDAVLILRTFTHRQRPGHTAWLAYVPQTPEPDSVDWVFGGQVKTQDDPLRTAELVAVELATQISRRVNSEYSQIEFDLT